ncbi:hypothetical protein L596_013036 [Steinernema carpocapsae]|uniref:Uncharacterized protein n=1 Tax=Steinernema carpocapsae TaxID=34508 RepID=A0A4U5NZG5_STECR|nr:hypothetical protein L596_013036 [Steinernema carpocapsae]
MTRHISATDFLLCSLLYEKPTTSVLGLLRRSRCREDGQGQRLFSVLDQKLLVATSCLVRLKLLCSRAEEYISNAALSSLSIHFG